MTIGGGSKKSKSTTKVELPEWYQDSAKGALGVAEGISSRPYEAFTGERIAAPNANLQLAYQKAAAGSPNVQSYLDQARGLLNREVGQFDGSTIDRYINPYVKNALDPVARELNEDFDATRRKLASTQVARHAFGGSRAALQESEAQENYLQSVSDLYAKGYAEAWDKGTALWEGDRDAKIQGDLARAQQLQSMAALAQQVSEADIENLLRTGAIDQDIAQKLLDFKYGQFIEERDWEVQNLQPWLDTLSSIRIPSSSTETSSGGGTNPLLGGVGAVLGSI